MRIWTVFWFLAATAIAVFVAINWQALAAPTIINLILWQVSAPLGLVMIGALLAVTMFYLMFLVWLETKALIQLSGRAGSSAAAVAELRSDLERQLGGFRIEAADSWRSLTARLEHMEGTMRQEPQPAESHVLSR